MAKLIRVVDTEAGGFHWDVIFCPECGEIQNAKVVHAIPDDLKLHTCVTCGFEIDASDWCSTVTV